MRRAIVLTLLLCVTSAVVVVNRSLLPIPESLALSQDFSSRKVVLDRLGNRLSYTLTGHWNFHEQPHLYQIPPLLQRAVIEAEDKRFYLHHGVDWWARLHATWQNIAHMRVVRGASTISEQVIRLLHPRRRSLWARFLEGIEARHLEERFSKGQILEFYLNQVPFAAQRRGISQASHYLWDRDLGTLSEREQLALAIIIRAPDRLNPYKNPRGLKGRITYLAHQLRETGAISDEQEILIAREQLRLESRELLIKADHFVRFIQRATRSDDLSSRVTTTLDSRAQKHIQSILDARIEDLRSFQVTDGAVLVVDNTDASVLAWVNAGNFHGEAGSQIDGVLIPRQPGSTLKPFVYAFALTKGWTATTLVNDAPLVQAVGAGAHAYRNYSRMYYGEIPLREALGNSLNVPAIRAAEFTGTHTLLEFLHKAGFSSLSEPAAHYGEGLALGNGEVTLFELVQGYAALANKGVFRPLRFLRADSDPEKTKESQPLVSPEVSSIIGDILSDPHARRREFGVDGLLRFPVETAIKTGTATDYRDAWALGYSSNFTVGVWMGNMNRSSMQEITGARGPALVLRSVLAELERERESKDLFRSPNLDHRAVCPLSGLLAGPTCPQIGELFVPGTAPHKVCGHAHTSPHAAGEVRPQHLEISMPTPGLNIARDPRIPDSAEKLLFELRDSKLPGDIHWIVDGVEVGVAKLGYQGYQWILSPGRHIVQAKCDTEDAHLESAKVGFWVR